MQLFENFTIPEKKKNSNQRSFLIDEIYELYIAPNQRIFRKKENWKRYCLFCRDHRIPNSPESQKKFKKSKSFIKEYPVSSIRFFISIIPTKDLHYIISVGKDMNNRNQNFGGYLMGNLTGKGNNSFPQS